jgi:hypothetical protein
MPSQNVVFGRHKHYFAPVGGNVKPNFSQFLLFSFFLFRGSAIVGRCELRGPDTAAVAALKKDLTGRHYF